MKTTFFRILNLLVFIVLILPVFGFLSGGGHGSFRWINIFMSWLAVAFRAVRPLSPAATTHTSAIRIFAWLFCVLLFTFGYALFIAKLPRMIKNANRGYMLAVVVHALGAFIAFVTSHDDVAFPISNILLTTTAAILMSAFFFLADWLIWKTRRKEIQHNSARYRR